jgi:hypothetical protein
MFVLKQFKYTANSEHEQVKKYFRMNSKQNKVIPLLYKLKLWVREDFFRRFENIEHAVKEESAVRDVKDTIHEEYPLVPKAITSVNLLFKQIMNMVQ